MRAPSISARMLFSRGPSASPPRSKEVAAGAPDSPSSKSIRSSMPTLAGFDAAGRAGAAPATRSKTTWKFGIFFSRIGHSSIIRVPSISTNSAGMGV